MAINEIKKEQDEELFGLLMEYQNEEISYDAHRRGSNFYRKCIIRINEKWFPTVDRELDGVWETNEYVWDSEYGQTDSVPYVLYRVNEVTTEKVVIETTFVKVTE